MKVQSALFVVVVVVGDVTSNRVLGTWSGIVTEITQLRVSKNDVDDLTAAIID